MFVFTLNGGNMVLAVDQAKNVLGWKSSSFESSGVLADIVGTRKTLVYTVYLHRIPFFLTQSALYGTMSSSY